jgi:hypothetical protein
MGDRDDQIVLTVRFAARAEPGFVVGEVADEFLAVGG